MHLLGSASLLPPPPAADKEGEDYHEDQDYSANPAER
jgi:hypothetical protein